MGLSSNNSPMYQQQIWAFCWQETQTVWGDMLWWCNGCCRGEILILPKTFPLGDSDNDLLFAANKNLYCWHGTCAWSWPDWEGERGRERQKERERENERKRMNGRKNDQTNEWIKERKTIRNPKKKNENERKKKRKKGNLLRVSLTCLLTRPHPWLSRGHGNTRRIRSLPEPYDPLWLITAWSQNG